VTAWLTAALAVERYVLVCHAARARQLFGTVRVQYVVAVIFVVTSVFSLPFAFRYRTVWTPRQVDALADNATNITDDISTVHIEVSPTAKSFLQWNRHRLITAIFKTLYSGKITFYAHSVVNCVT